VTQSRPPESGGQDAVPSFLDDFFAESEEHLALVREKVLQLERFSGKSGAPRTLIEDLFRSFHTLKGLAAMVGYGECEELAHAMESYLKFLRQPGAVHDAGATSTLVLGVKALEKALAQRQSNRPATDVSPVLAKLSKLAAGKEMAPPTAGERLPVSPDATVTLKEDERRVLQAALRAGAKPWRLRFKPSKALAERGVTVASIRERLQALGDIVSATPQVQPGSGVVFDFVVAVKNPERTTFADWEPDGVTATAYDVVNTAAPDDANANANAILVPARIVRVDLSRLDDLMQRVGELVVTRWRWVTQMAKLEPYLPEARWRELEEISGVLERQLRDLREDVMRVRLVPVGELFGRMPFVVRDLSNETGKRVRLDISGQDIEVDKMVLDRIMEPVLHIVRNSVVHGFETPAERESHGKPAEGTLRLAAATSGEHVVITIQDDGLGIDRDRIRQKAAAVGLPVTDERLTDEALLSILCAPGFSTKDEADRGAGRGVGMAVVRGTVSELGGTLALHSEEGQGTRFVIHLPVTVSILESFVVTAGDQTLAVPLASVSEIISVEPDHLSVLENNHLLPYRTGVIPLRPLSTLFSQKHQYSSRQRALVVTTPEGDIGLVVDQVLGQREIVVTPLSDPLIRVSGVAGATQTGEGHVMLIIDAVRAAEELAPERLAATASSRRGHA
jgi:two-component system chemotaxis sensor kinase CheA